MTWRTGLEVVGGRWDAGPSSGERESGVLCGAGRRLWLSDSLGCEVMCGVEMGGEAEAGQAGDEGRGGPHM